MHTCAILDSGTLMSWGLNTNGQVGKGYTSFEEPTPTVIDIGTGRKVV